MLVEIRKLSHFLYKEDSIDQIVFKRKFKSNESMLPKGHRSTTSYLKCNLFSLNTIVT